MRLGHPILVTDPGGVNKTNKRPEQNGFYAQIPSRYTASNILKLSHTMHVHKWHVLEMNCTACGQAQACLLNNKIFGKPINRAIYLNRVVYFVN